MKPNRIEYLLEVNKDARHKSPTHAMLIVSCVGVSDPTVKRTPRLRAPGTPDDAPEEFDEVTIPGSPVYSADIGSLVGNQCVPLHIRAEGSEDRARLALADILERLARELRS